VLGPGTAQGAASGRPDGYLRRTNILPMNSHFASRGQLPAPVANPPIHPAQTWTAPGQGVDVNSRLRHARPHFRACAVALALFSVWLRVEEAHCGEAPQPSNSAGKSPAQVLVAFYSLTGNTEQMARGVVEGVRRVPGVTAVLKKVDEVSKADLEAADGLILGGPTYYGNIPGKMKVVIDDWSWKMKVDFTDKVGGAFSTGGGQVGGKEFVVVSLLMFMLNNRMVVAGPLYQNDRTGSVWAEAGAAAMTGPLDPGVSKTELEGAQRLGERVAGLASKLKPAQSSKQAGK
jgi:multimeric flavodoxin WrbA